MEVIFKLHLWPLHTQLTPHGKSTLPFWDADKRICKSPIRPPTATWPFSQCRNRWSSLAYLEDSEYQVSDLRLRAFFRSHSLSLSLSSLLLFLSSSLVKKGLESYQWWLGNHKQIICFRIRHRTWGRGACVWRRLNLDVVMFSTCAFWWMNDSFSSRWTCYSFFT